MFYNYPWDGRVRTFFETAMRTRVVQVLSQHLATSPSARNTAGTALCVVLIYDLITRWTWLDLFYTDKGVFPQQQALEHARGIFWFDVFRFLPSWWWARFIFFSDFFFLAMAGFGPIKYKSDAFFFSWIFHSCLLFRNLLIDNGGDTLACIALFCFSLMNFSRKKRIMDIGGALLIFQISLMYVTSHFHKSHPWWRSDFRAVQMVLQFETIRTPMGSMYSSAVPSFVHGATTAAVLWFQLIGGIALLFKNTRAVAATGFIMMHLVFGMLLNIGVFAWIPIALLLIVCEPACSIRDTRVPRRMPRSPQVFTVMGIAFLLYFQITFSMTSLDLIQDKNVPMSDLIKHFFVDQHWNMFSPRPPDTSWWVSLRGKTSLYPEGIELLRRSAFWTKEVVPASNLDEKPSDLEHLFTNVRMFRYFFNLVVHYKNSIFLESFGHAVCERWMYEDDPLKEMDLYWIGEEIFSNGSRTFKGPNHLWSFQCS